MGAEEVRETGGGAAKSLAREGVSGKKKRAKRLDGDCV